jgi:hypothetical protein
VGYELYRQIRDLAPQNWTSGELVVALMIADSAGEHTRRSYLDANELSRRARMSPRGVSKALEKLKEKGFEFRVSKGRDHTGKDIYAVSGKQVEYQVPDIFMQLEKGAAVAYGLVDKLAAAGTTVPAAGELSTETSRYHSTGQPVPQYRLRRSHGLLPLNLRTSTI